MSKSNLYSTRSGEILGLINNLLTALFFMVSICMTSAVIEQNSGGFGYLVLTYGILLFTIVFAIFRGANLGVNIGQILIGKKLSWRWEIVAKSLGTNFGVYSCLMFLLMSIKIAESQFAIN